MIPLCMEEGVGAIPWSPLARGLLAGTRKRGESEGPTIRARTDEPAHSMYSDADYSVVERVEQIAAQRGIKPAQVALACLLSKDAVSAPIIGVSKVQHLVDAVASLVVRIRAP